MNAPQRSEAVDETALAVRCRKQDVEAFGKVVDLYDRRIYGFVRRMVGSHEDCSDLTQEVFIRAFQNFDRFDGRSSIKTWLFRIAYNMCIDRLRKAGRSIEEISIHSAVEEEDFDAPDVRWQPERVALESEFVATLEAAIQSMSEKLRSVLLLHDREDASYEEIAQMLGLPIGTVKSRLFLARAHLQRELRPFLEGEALK